MLSCGASLLGAGAVVAVDIDGDSLHILKENIEYTELDNVNIIQCDFLCPEMYRYVLYFNKTNFCKYLMVVFSIQ